eukprot:gene12146-2754_t
MIFNETRRDETRRDETRRDETRRDETKRKEKKRNMIFNETKRNETKRNEKKRKEKKNTSVGRPIEENEEITQTLREFWKQESSGIDKGSEPTNENKQDEQFEITFNGKRYQVSLPWKVDISCLNDDYNLALNRLKSLRCRLKGNPELLSEYDNIFKEQLNNEIIEQVPVEEENQGNPHFMSHHGVIRRDRETTKLRVVFDGSAKSHKEALSLNECLKLDKKKIDEALEIFHKSREILSEGGFNLRKFKTNDTALLHEIKKVETGNVSNGDNAKEIIQDDQSFAQQTIGPPQRENNNKVLGVNWENTSVGRPVEENEEITQTLREFWKQESSGIDKGSEPTNEDKQDEQFEITFNGKRYQEPNTEANQVNAPIAPAQPADRTITRSKRAAAKLGEFLRKDNM